MAVGAAFQWVCGDSAAVVNPPTGSVKLGVDCALGPYSKAPGTPGGTDGAVTFFGITLEAFQDAVAGMFVDSAWIDFVYDDGAGTVTATIKPGSVTPTELSFDPATQAELDVVSAAIAAHLADASDAHDASAISVVPTGTVAAVDVQAAIAELDTEKATTGSVSTVASDLAAHLADATDAHDASAVSFVPAAGIGATDVQAAIVEDAGDLSAHLADTSDAHDASAISLVPTGDVAATDVQGAVAELASEKATTGSVSTVATNLADHISDPTDAHDASAVSFAPAAGIAATDVQAAIVEDAGDLAAHLSDTVDAHDASAISYAGSSGLSAADVEAALDELDSEKQPLDPTLTALAGQNWADDAMPVGTGADTMTQLAIAANRIPGRASGDANILAKTVTDPGFAFLAAATTAAETALLDEATTSLKGLLSPGDWNRIRGTFDAETDFGFVGDLVTVFDGAMTTGGGATTLTCATSAPFAATDVGKRITVAGAGASGAQLTTTIATFVSSSIVTLTVGCSTTVTNKGVGFGTDNTAAITAMTTMVNTTLASFPGCKVMFGRSVTNAYGFPIPVVFNKTVILEGIGGGFNTDNGDYTRIGGTRLAWWGTTSDGGVDFGAFITFIPGAGASQALKQPGLRDLWLDGWNGAQNSALYGVRFAGCHAPILSNVFAMDFRASPYLCNAVPAAVAALNPTADRGVLRPAFRDIFSRQLETFVGAITTPITTTTAITLTNAGQNITVSAATMPVDAASTSYAWVQTTEGVRCLVKYTGGGTTTLNVKCSVEDAAHGYLTVSGSNVASAAPVNAACMTLDGDLTANTNCGIIEMSQFTHGTVWGPAAWDIRNCDSMDIIDPYVNGGAPADLGAINRITKEGFTFAGSNVNVVFPARNIVVRSGDAASAAAAGATAFGCLNTGTTIAFKMAHPSGPNYWDLYQLGNGARRPNVEPGASFDWNPNGGLRKTSAPTVSIANQGPINPGVLTQITGSLVTLPPQWAQPGTAIEWEFVLSKTASGTVGTLFQIRVGTLGTIADAIVQACTTGVGTGAVDTAVFKIRWVMQAPGAAATTAAVFSINARQAATAAGWIATPTACIVMTPTAFSTVTSGLQYASIAVTPGTIVTATAHQCAAQVINPANP